MEHPIVAWHWNDPNLERMQGKAAHSAVAPTVGPFRLRYVSARGGETSPAHSHPHDQVVTVICGAATMTCGGEAIRLTAGSGLQIPAGVEHGMSCHSDVEFIEFAIDREPVVD